MRTFLWLAFSITFILLFSAIGIEVAALDPALSEKLNGARDLVKSTSSGAWAFARPLLQLAVVLLIMDWLARRLGLNIQRQQFRGNWTVQTFIAGLIITTFCIAVLADIQAVGYLKDVVLIVIGFYFGTRAKVERQDTVVAEVQPTNSYESGENPFANDHDGSRNPE